MPIVDHIIAILIIAALLVQFRFARSQRKRLEKSLARLKHAISGVCNRSEGALKTNVGEIEQPVIPRTFLARLMPNFTLKYGLNQLEKAQEDESLKDVTLIIPTHCRHRYLTRALKFYYDWNLRIIVTDSTEERFSDVLTGKVSYLHRPSLPFAEKLKEALEMVQTPMVLVAADDDFISPAGVIKAIMHLHKNPKCACAQGWHSAFSHSPLGRIKWHSIHFFAKTYKVDDSNSANRILNQAELYMNCFYALHRTHVLKHYFSDVCPQLPKDVLTSRPELLEVGQALTTVAWGYHVVLPVLWIAREILADSSGATANASTEGDEAAKRFFSALANSLAEYIPHNCPQEVLESAMVRFQHFQERWNKLEIPHFQSLKKVVRAPVDQAFLSRISEMIRPYTSVH